MKKIISEGTEEIETQFYMRDCFLLDTVEWSTEGLGK